MCGRHSLSGYDAAILTDSDTPSKPEHTTARLTVGPLSRIMRDEHLMNPWANLIQ